jgi:hypothetical protein
MKLGKKYFSEVIFCFEFLLSLFSLAIIMMDDVCLDS